MSISFAFLNRFQIYLGLYCLFFIISMMTRLGLLLWFPISGDTSFFSYIRIFLVGGVYDLAFYLYASLPVILVLWLTPEKIWHLKLFQRTIKLVIVLSVYLLCLIAVAEFIFWDEFHVRFNFISVDYLVYRKEVIGNIQQSYPVISILASILPFTLLLILVFRKYFHKTLLISSSFSKRTWVALSLIMLMGLAYLLVDQSLRSIFTNNFKKELASNGSYQFFAAFRNNKLDYDEFYKKIEPQKADRIIKKRLKTDNSVFLKPDELFNIARHIDNSGTEKKLNVILISIESLSAKYLSAFGNKENITPFFDTLAKESLFFTNFYATGTRTTRGLESITLSIPPTPGRSVVKRIGHEGDMWSLGNIMRSKGYQSTFLYGGRSYFDNMNQFFSKNGYDVVDQSDIPDDEIKFENIWGVSDEDLYEETLKQADIAVKKNQPFFFHLMTTSNHRPYTYPDNKIDIPSGDGRSGAVKYTDFAIKRFINWAKSKPWFDDTIFVILADHCSGSAGRENLPIKKYHIPLWIYSPKHIKPQIISKRAGQIDIAPTLLGLLNMDYDSWFFGQDILLNNDKKPQALIANYQYLGLYQDQTLTLLKPKKQIEQYDQINTKSKQTIKYHSKNIDKDKVEETISYYQSAAYILKHQLNSWSAHYSKQKNHK